MVTGGISTEAAMARMSCCGASSCDVSSCVSCVAAGELDAAGVVESWLSLSSWVEVEQAPKAVTRARLARMRGVFMPSSVQYSSRSVASGG